MAVAQLLLSMEPKYICHNQCTMDTSSPVVPKLSTEILLIPAILELYHKPPLKFNSSLIPKNLSSFVLRSGGRNATISDVCHIVTNYVFCLSVYFLSARRGVFPLLLGIPLRRDLMVNLYLCGCTTYFMLHNG